MKKKLVILFFVLTGNGVVAQQDPQYSQYMFNQVILNPAYIGTKDAFSTTALLRKQWTAMPGSPTTINLSASGPLKKKSIGIGGHLVQEKIGAKSWLGVYGDFCYKIKVGAAGKLSFGLSAGIVNYTFDINKLELKDAADPLVNGDLGNRTKFDANAGIFYHTNSFYAGLSYTHITKPALLDIATQISSGENSVIVYNLNPHAFFTLGKGFRISENLVFNPSLVFRMIREGKSNGDLNFNFLIKEKLWLGFSARSSNTSVIIAQYRFSNKLKLGYSYDRPINSAFKQFGASHEIMLGYDFGNYKTKTVSPRYL